MDPQLNKAVKTLKEMHPDAWEIFKNFLTTEREVSLLDFGNYDTIKEPQLLAHLSGMIGQADRILRVIEDAEESNG